jgi:DNA mismatch endonuclease (patch repair protein)
LALSLAKKLVSSDINSLIDGLGGEMQGLATIADPLARASKARPLLSRRAKQLTRLLHRAGYSYRLNRADLPGRPEVVLREKRAAIFVHDCFANRHQGCPWCTMPLIKQRYWQAKFEHRVERDDQARIGLLVTGWRVAVVWECSLGKTADDTITDLINWLESSAPKFETPLVAALAGSRPSARAPTSS